MITVSVWLLFIFGIITGVAITLGFIWSVALKDMVNKNK